MLLDTLSRARAAALALVLAACGEIHAPVDDAGVADAHPEPPPEADASPPTDAGPLHLREGGIATGFEPGPRLCAGSLCLEGGITP